MSTKSGIPFPFKLSGFFNDLKVLSSKHNLCSIVIVLKKFTFQTLNNKNVQKQAQWSMLEAVLRDKSHFKHS